ncbi:MAG: hypothetical protein AB1758_30280 [Candidatus Eremiobacterota bacterium]
MQAIMPETLSWEQDGTVYRAALGQHELGGSEVRIEMLEVPAGASLAPHSHKEQHLYLCVVRSGGAQLYLGGRLFRPLAGQSFTCEPNDVLAVCNDTPHPLRMMVTRVGFKPDDRVPADKTWEELVSSARSQESGRH